MLPALLSVDSDLTDQLGKSVLDGNGETLGALGRLDPVAVLPFVLFELDIVKENEGIGAVDFVKVTEPGKKERVWKNWIRK